MSLLDEEEIKDLERLEKLLTGWNVDFVLVTDAYSLRALGFNVKKRRHINVIVNTATLPWSVNREAKHEVFSPRNSIYFRDYLEFIEKGASLHLIPYSFRLFKKIPTIEYELPNKKKIKTTNPSDGVKMFAEEMKRYNIEEIGEYKIREWLDKIDYWMRIAEECKDREFVKSCEQAIRDVKAYFNLQ